MTTDPAVTLADAVRVALAENGVGGPGSSLHGWRCEYPDRYGECDCVAEVVSDVIAAAPVSPTAFGVAFTIGAALLDALTLVLALVFGRRILDRRKEVLAMLKRHRAEILAVLIGVALAIAATAAVLHFCALTWTTL